MPTTTSSWPRRCSSTSRRRRPRRCEILRRLVGAGPAPEQVVEDEKTLADARALLAKHPVDDGRAAPAGPGHGGRRGRLPGAPQGGGGLRSPARSPSARRRSTRSSTSSSRPPTTWCCAARAAPPDADHAYGHGKFENLAALGQGLFLLAAAAALVWAGVAPPGLAGGRRGRAAWGWRCSPSPCVVSVAVPAPPRPRRRAQRQPGPQGRQPALRTDLWTNGAALLALAPGALDRLVAGRPAGRPRRGGGRLAQRRPADRSKPRPTSPTAACRPTSWPASRR